MTEKDILILIKKDKWMMDILRVVERLNLPDWWIGAGFVRGKVWDILHGYKKRTPLPDIDVVYFDKSDFSSETEYEKILKKQMPEVKWSVTNQARMHVFHNNKPYANSEEALSKWVETATCVGVRLNKNNKVILTAPWGIEDLVTLILRPTPGTDKNSGSINIRIREKKWIKKWKKLKILDNS